MLLAFCFIYGFIQEKEKKVRDRADESDGLQSSDTQKPESQNNKNSTGKGHTIFQFFHKAIINPVVITIIVSFAVVVINFLITFAKNKDFVIESVLDYNETFNIIIAVASLITMIIIALIQYKIQQAGEQKNQIIQQEAQERNKKFEDSLRSELAEREKIRKQQEHYNLISKNLKEYLDFKDYAEMLCVKNNNTQEKELIIIICFQDEIAHKYFAVNVAENDIDNSLSFTIPTEKDKIVCSTGKDFKLSNIELIGNKMFLHIKLISDASSKAIIKFINNCFQPMYLYEDLLEISFKCNFEDQSLLECINLEEKCQKSLINWDMQLNFELKPTKTISKEKHLVLKCDFKKGLLYE